MKIKVEVTLDVDVEAWMLNYGVEKSDVRGDVKFYFENICREQLGHIDCEKEK